MLTTYVVSHECSGYAKSLCAAKLAGVHSPGDIVRWYLLLQPGHDPLLTNQGMGESHGTCKGHFVKKFYGPVRVIPTRAPEHGYEFHKLSSQAQDTSMAPLVAVKSATALEWQ